MNDSATKSKTLLALQLTLWIVCAFHVFIGAGLNLSDAFVDTAARLYGAEQTEWNAQFLYILRPLGVFMDALSIFAGAAALNPSRHRLTIYVFAGIFIVRGAQRVLFGDQISELYGIEDGRNVTNMVFFFFSGGLLIALDQLSHRGEADGDRSTAQAAA